MSKKKGFLPRVLMFIALACLGAVFLAPLWQITLDAPQFPGGLYLDIWVDGFSGDEEGGDIIQNINILNHYIGMQFIEPDAIPELTYFPYILYVMLTLGLIVMLVDRAWSYFTWTAILVVLGILGVYDFYLWLYDYGHNLDPNAPIQVPGMVYQPPLFGEKDLLNFYVTSYPRTGGVMLGCAMLFGSLAWFFRRRISRG
jgi:hypothetical protein